MSKEDFRGYISDIQESLFEIECIINTIDDEVTNDIPDDCDYKWFHAMHHFSKMKDLVDMIANKLDEEEEDD